MVAAVALFGAGCTPTCREACRKLDRCDLLAGIDVEECRETCEADLDNRQVAKRDDDDPEPLKTFNAHRRCLGSSTCDDIADGVCFDDDLFLIGE